MDLNHSFCALCQQPNAAWRLKINLCYTEPNIQIS